MGQLSRLQLLSSLQILIPSTQQTEASEAFRRLRQKSGAGFHRYPPHPQQKEHSVRHNQTREQEPAFPVRQLHYGHTQLTVLPCDEVDVGGVPGREVEQPAVGGHHQRQERDHLQTVGTEVVVGTDTESGDDGREEDHEQHQRLQHGAFEGEEDRDKGDNEFAEGDYGLPVIGARGVPTVEEAHLLLEGGGVEGGTAAVEVEKGEEGNPEGPDQHSEQASREGEAKVVADPALLAELLLEIGGGVDGDTVEGLEEHTRDGGVEEEEHDKEGLQKAHRHHGSVT